jgi:2-hydroxychromene-2-carboxylate isomerase
MRVTWYFDFLSPFAYLQFHELRALSMAQFDLQPVVLARLLDAHGHLGPAEIPAKRDFTYRHVVWLAEQAGVPLRFPGAGHPFNSLPLLRLATAHHGDPAVIERLFRYVWVDGWLPQQAGPWRALLDELNLASDEVPEQVNLQLRATTELAIAAGVFGVPTACVDGRVFWGLDSTGMLAEYLRDPVAFAARPYGASPTVPVAARRARAAEGSRKGEHDR